MKIPKSLGKRTGLSGHFPRDEKVQTQVGEQDENADNRHGITILSKRGGRESAGNNQSSHQCGGPADCLSAINCRRVPEHFTLKNLLHSTLDKKSGLPVTREQFFGLLNAVRPHPPHGANALPDKSSDAQQDGTQKGSEDDVQNNVRP